MKTMQQVTRHVSVKLEPRVTYFQRKCQFHFQGVNGRRGCGQMAYGWDGTPDCRTICYDCEEHLESDKYFAAAGAQVEV